MPVHFGYPDDFMGKVIAPVVPAAPITPLMIGEEAAIGSIDWTERLRTTAELLQKLSDSYPFTWHRGE